MSENNGLNKASIIKKKRTNLENDEEKSQTKRACLCTQGSGSRLIEEVHYLIVLSGIS